MENATFKPVLRHSLQRNPSAPQLKVLTYLKIGSNLFKNTLGRKKRVGEDGRGEEGKR